MKKILTLFVLFVGLTACQNANKQSENQEKTVESMETEVKQIPVTDAKVIVLLAHPNIAESKANAALSKAASEVKGVQVINIYDYPVTPEAYSEVIGRANTLVYEFPCYWMSAPHLLKQWTDEVFMAFVTQGKIEGKQFMVVTTTGSEETAYQHGGRNKYTMEEYLRPYEGMANHAKMVWQKPLVVYGQSLPDAATTLAAGVEGYKARLGELVK